MAKIERPVRFSTHFGFGASHLSERGAFDPILNADTPLFIDPLLLAKSRHAEMRSASKAWHDYFRKVVKLLAASKATGDVPWKSALKMLLTPEFKGTCLGYGAGSIKGRGIGGQVAAQIVATAREIIDLGIRDPEFFALLPLFEEGVGSDLISDQTTQIIAPYLAEFTVRTIQGTGVATEDFDVGPERFRLPTNPFARDGRLALPVIVTPKDVLADLPVAHGPEDIDAVASHNRAMRSRVNKRVGRIWTKWELRRAVLSEKDAFEEFLRRNSDSTPYDVDDDSHGRVRWLEDGQKIAQQQPLALRLVTHDSMGLKSVVTDILDHFKVLIEDKAVWKNLYSPNGNALPESYAQKLLFVLADAYCRANNIDITPEANSGPGPVDFKFSSGYASRLVVEIKLSTNPRIRQGYTRQLEKYRRADEGAAGVFLVIDVGGTGTQLSAIKKLESEAIKQGAPHSQIFVIDGNRQSSASRH